MKIKITEPQYKELNKVLIKDKKTIDELQSKFTQWDFTNAKIRREKNPKGQTYRFLDGLYCNKHKTTNDNINVSDLLKRGSGCRECGREKQIESGMTKKPLEQWVLDLDKVGFETKIENFKYMKNSSGKNSLYVKDAICKNCNNKITKYVSAWEMNSGKITCPECSVGKWKGEETVKKILSGMGLVENVDFFPKYKFDGLKGKLHRRATSTGFSKETSLPYYFDFYIPKWNTIIEYDGEYHFNIKPGRHDEKKLNEYIFRDIQKNNFAKDNGIDMIRISYKTKAHKKDVIEQEIESSLSKLKKLRSDNKDTKGNIITTGNYPNLGWNSPNL
jgi:very-short-patch-repair endonuclease